MWGTQKRGINNEAASHSQRYRHIYIILWYLHGDHIHLQSYILLNSIFEASKMHDVRELRQSLHCIMYDCSNICAHVRVLRTLVTFLLCHSLRQLLIPLIWVPALRVTRRLVTMFPNPQHWSVFEASLSHSSFEVLTAVLTGTWLHVLFDTA